MEGCTSSGTNSKRFRPKDDFTNLVLSWSPHDILDVNLYQNQMENIPDSFESVDHYLGSFVFLLLEETRSELASALQTVGKAPYAEITSLKELKHSKSVYRVKVDQWRNGISDRGREPYRTLPGDVFLISDLKPQSDSDLRRAGHFFTIACVKNISEGEGGNIFTDSDFKLKMSEHINEFSDGRSSRLFYVVHLVNLTTHKRIWNALRMRQNTTIIEKVLKKNDSRMETCEFCPLKCNGDMKMKATSLSKLNESQREAVLSSLSKIECNHRPTVELIWGPPGTGKTTTLCSLLYTLLTLKIRTIICAPTNVAITELATRVLDLVRSSVKSESENNCSSGDMLIYGNVVNLKVSSDIEDIFLEDRIEGLENCLTSWKHCIASMLDFLEGCVHQHSQRVVNDNITKAKSLLEFARDRFSCLAKPLRNCMLTAVTHLPRSLINEQSFRSIEQLMSLLDSVEMLLFKDSSVTFQPFDDIKSKCVSVLRFLQTYPDKLGLQIGANRSSTEKFCFQNASLIFCTTSSAYKLHSVDMKPFSVLVIDEAAQVKECESIIALQIPFVSHAILVGDERQLPPTIKSKMCEELGFGRSLFKRLSSLGHSKHLLDVQYRMHPSISQFPNSKFYRNRILDAPCVQSLSYEKCYLQGKMFGPYSFINVGGGNEEPDDIGHSKRNVVEVAVTVKLVQKLFEAWNGTNEKLSIGVISPYAAQVAMIQNKLEHKFKNLEGFIVNVKSVDGFQGGEEDIIIMSTVRSHSGGSIGFLSSPQRTNVALTRARHCLWILGNERTLSRSDSVWKALIFDAKQRRCFFIADEDCEIREIIVKVKKELGQTEDLLTEESILFRNSIWKVLFSDNFRRTFQILIPSNVKNLVISMLLKLANGWRPRKVNVDCSCRRSSYVVKQFKVDRYFIVCSIDIIEKDAMYVQVLKVWDVLPMNETWELLNKLDNISANYTDVFINHCNEKLFEGNLEVPKSWLVSSDIIRYKDRNATSTSDDESQSYVERSRVSESLLLMKFYSLSTGAVNHLLTDVEGTELDLPSEVTDEERMIIMFPRSSFILGRSGTGKTTVLTMKLIRNFQQHRIASRESVGADNKLITDSSTITLHQLFVTVSPKLCCAVKKHVSQLKRFSCENLSGKNVTESDDIDEMAEFEDIPDTFDGISQEKYPLIITFQKFLMMLDGTIGNSYFQRFRDLRGSSRSEGVRSVALQTFIRNNEVTYDRFKNLYWPHINAKLTKDLDPSRVFTEIMSHIKGGVSQDGKAVRSRRTRKDYVSLLSSRVSNLNAEKRDKIYDIFQDYEKMKLGRGEFDLADFVIDIHLRLKNESNLLCDKMDFVYIDEVQDLTMSQISLFKYICKNVDDGFVFCGDTAQTIARGIDFRFEDIRSLFYTEFFMKSANSEVRGGEKGVVSDMFSLSKNFRTHTGVLRLAQSVTDLISHFFPQSIDVLPPETSLIYGESPVVLKPGSDENKILTIFGQVREGGEKWVGFGADQVILVRDDSARQEISKNIGHQALILTILECKGLEFEDVLLYNFFGSSPLSNQWRVVYEFLKEKDMLGSNSPNSFPSFSQLKHNILCSELKQLYVAITRTKQKLWIYENNEEFSKPMIDYWRSLSLVKVREFGDSIAREMQTSSSPEEWKSQGIKLFWEKNYDMAMMCFEKSGEEKWEKRAKASKLRACADTLRVSDPAEAQKFLREAAEIFDSIGRADSAAECFCDLGEYERAGWIYMEKCGTSELRKAGECFSLAGHHKIAAEAYAKGYFFKECLYACYKGKVFDLGLHYIENWRHQASSDSGSMKKKIDEIEKNAQDFLEKCALVCFREKDNTSMMKLVTAFRTMESKRFFLKSWGFLDELLNLEVELGNFNEAGEIAKSIGNVPLEAGLLEKAHEFEKASSLVLSYVLSKSLWVSGSRGWPIKPFPEKDELLSNAMSVASKVSGTFHALVCAEAEILSHKRAGLSDLVQRYGDFSKRYKNCTGTILSVRNLLDAHLDACPADYESDHELFGEIMSSGRVSAGSLFYVWNLWKLHSLEILDCLSSIGSVGPAGCTDKGNVRFCFDFFGARLLQDSSVLVLNPKAAWTTNVYEDLVPYRDTAILEARKFVSAAKNFWCKELIFSDGLYVLESFRALYEYSHLSKFCQSMCLVCIFDISRFLITKSKSLDIEQDSVGELHKFLELSTGYFQMVFPLDTRNSLSENKMVSLRGTKYSRNLLEEIILTNIGGRNNNNNNNKLSYGQIGRVMMMMLGSGPPRRCVYEKIVERLYDGSSLKSFVEKNKPSHELYQALEESYNSPGWRLKKDYKSPNCFFYLVERLLILAPRSRGYFFATKSSFAEYLISLPSDADPRAGVVTEGKSNPTSINSFVVKVVRECVLNNLGSTEEWIELSDINCEYYFPVLMLRLFMILCVLCLSSEMSFDVVSDMLDVVHVGSQLPREFCEAFRRDWKNDNFNFVAVVAKAFKVIGDPLVIVTTGHDCPDFVCPDAIFLDLTSFSSRAETVKTLFPTCTEAS